jgi:hypothetical protein
MSEETYAGHRNKKVVASSEKMATKRYGTKHCGNIEKVVNTNN